MWQVKVNKHTRIHHYRLEGLFSSAHKKTNKQLFVVFTYQPYGTEEGNAPVMTFSIHLPYILTL